MSNKTNVTMHARDMQRLTAGQRVMKAVSLSGTYVFLGLMALVPYARMLALGSHSLDHFFFTYRAQMASIMAVIAILAYSLKPSEVLRPKKRRACHCPNKKK